MAIKVRFIATLKEVTGTEMVQLDSSFNTLAKVMTELLRLYPQLQDNLFYSDGSLQFICHMLLNGHSISWPKDKDKEIKVGDEFILMIFVAGG